MAKKKKSDTTDKYYEETYHNIVIDGIDELGREVRKEFILKDATITIDGHCKFI